MVGLRPYGERRRFGVGTLWPMVVEDPCVTHMVDSTHRDCAYT